jgi:hypothetical protein
MLRCAIGHGEIICLGEEDAFGNKRDGPKFNSTPMLMLSLLAVKPSNCGLEHSHHTRRRNAVR